MLRRDFDLSLAWSMFDIPNNEINLKILTCKNFLYPPDLAVSQTHFYSVRVKCGVSENIFDDTNSLFAGSLVRFEDDRDF